MRFSRRWEAMGYAEHAQEWDFGYEPVIFLGVDPIYRDSAS